MISIEARELNRTERRTRRKDQLALLSLPLSFHHIMESIDDLGLFSLEACEGTERTREGGKERRVFLSPLSALGLESIPLPSPLEEKKRSMVCILDLRISLPSKALSKS